MSLTPKASAFSVAVTGLHRGANPQPGAAVAASLRRVYPNVRIIGLCYDAMESALFSNGLDRVDSAFMLPYPRAGIEAFLERLRDVVKQEKPALVIPCLDAELPSFVQARLTLDEWGIKCVLPGRRSLSARDKTHLADFCGRHGIPSPKTTVSTRLGVLLRAAERIGFPLYVKGRFYEAQLVHSPTELSVAFNRLVDTWGGPVLVQESITGEEYDLLGLGDGRGGILGHCAIRKLLKTSLGKGFAGVVVQDPRLDVLARKAVQALRWNGPFELEFIKAPGRPHQLIEMNPRFPAWVDFASQIGCNLPAILAADALELGKIPAEVCQPGRVFVRHCLDLAGDISDIARLVGLGGNPDALSGLEQQHVS